MDRKETVGYFWIYPSGKASFSHHLVHSTFLKWSIKGTKVCFESASDGGHRKPKVREVSGNRQNVSCGRLLRALGVTGFSAAGQYEARMVENCIVVDLRHKVHGKHRSKNYPYRSWSVAGEVHALASRENGVSKSQLRRIAESRGCEEDYPVRTLRDTGRHNRVSVEIQGRIVLRNKTE